MTHALFSATRTSQKQGRQFFQTCLKHITHLKKSLFIILAKFYAIIAFSEKIQIEQIDCKQLQVTQEQTQNNLFNFQFF